MLTPMKIKNSIYKIILSSKNQAHIRLGLACLSSFFVMALFYFYTGTKIENKKELNDNSINLSVMIPEGYVLFSFEAENYEQVSPLLEPYSMVKVYSTKTGQMLAQNIKVLRAPKDPSQLSFLMPVKIANYFAHLGLEYQIVIQKYDESKKPQLIKNNYKRQQDVIVTYGEPKDENN